MDYKDFVEEYDQGTLSNLQEGFKPITSSISKAEQRCDKLTKHLSDILAEQQMYISKWCTYYKKYSRIDIQHIMEDCEHMTKLFKEKYTEYQDCVVDGTQYRFDRYVYMISFLAIKSLQTIKSILDVCPKWLDQVGKCVFDFQIKLLDIVITNTI